MDNLDKELRDFFQKDIDLPYSYKNIVRTTLKRNEKNKMKQFKIPVIICCSLILLSTAVFANTIIKNKTMKYYNNSDGLDTAIKNGYIEEPNMDFIMSNGSEAKVEDYLMDDFNLSFTFNIKLQEELDVNKIVKAQISNFIITDDDNNIIYCDNKELLDEFKANNNLDFEFRKYNEKYIDNGINTYIRKKDSKTNSFELVYNLYSKGYPKSKKLNLKFLNINLFKSEDIEESGISLEGIWEINLNVPEKFYNREAIIYKFKSLPNEKIYCAEAVVYDTCMKVHFIEETEKIYDEEDTEEEIHRKLLERLEKDSEDRKNGIYLTNSENSYVETEDGTRYYPINSSTEDTRVSDAYLDGFLECWQTFSLTKSNISNKLKVVIDIRGKEYIFELER